ncbi:MAG: tetratricopeptide repeat protein [Sphingobacteriales bacterium]
MTRKQFIFIAVILLAAFAGITIVKYWGHQGQSDSSTVTAKSDYKQTFWTYYNRATGYRLESKTDSSITAYQEALKLNPNHEDALYYIGNMYIKVDKFEKAREALEKLIKLNPLSEQAYIQLGNLYFCAKNTNYFHPEKAKSYFNRAKELNKETLSPNLRLGEIALFQNRTKDAFGIFNKLSMMDQKNAEIFFIIGYLNWKSGREQEAAKGLQRAFELGITAMSTNEQVGTGTKAKKAAAGKNQEGNLFMDWLNGNLTVAKKYDINVEMPKLYKKFDQYLIETRKQLNRD